MNHSNKRFSGRWTGLAAILFLVATSASATKEYYSISRSIRALGMGGAFYGLSNDQNALFYNPAGLAFYAGGTDVMVQTGFDMSIPAITALTKGVTSISTIEAFQGSPIYAGASFMPYFLKKYFSVGLLVADSKNDFVLVGKDLDSSIDITVILDSGLFVGFAVPLKVKGLVVGATVKGLFRKGGRVTYSILGIAQGSAFSANLAQVGGAGGGLDADLGSTYDLPEFFPGITLRTSLVFNNVLGSPLSLLTLKGTPAPAGLPRMLTLAGYARFPGFWVFNHVSALLDLAEFGLGGGVTDVNLGARSGSFWKHVNLGVEIPMWNLLYWRLGFRQGNFTAGLGLDARFFQFDIATYAEELANLPGRLTSRRVALRLAFGYGGRNPSTVPAATRTQVPSPAAEAVQRAPEPGVSQPPRAPSANGAKGRSGAPVAH